MRLESFLAASRARRARPLPLDTSPKPHQHDAVRAAALVSTVFFASCTTIEIAERDAFDVKRVVTSDLLESRGVTRDELRIETRDGLALSAWYLHREDPRGLVVVYGGNGFLMLTSRALVGALAGLPVDVLLFDYRGYGTSEGEPTVDALKADALTVFDYATHELGFESTRVLAHGHSLGSFVALHVAEHRPLAGIVLENPVTSVEDLVGGLVPWFLDPLVRFDIDPELAEPDNVEPMRRDGPPVLIFGGGEDDIAPIRMARELQEVAPDGRARLVAIEDGGHNDLSLDPRFARAYRDFVDEL